MNNKELISKIEHQLLNSRKEVEREELKMAQLRGGIFRMLWVLELLESARKDEGVEL